MIRFLMEHTALTIVLAYAALVVVAGVLLMVWMDEDERSGANASPGFCRTLGRGLRRLGDALGRIRP